MHLGDRYVIDEHREGETPAGCGIQKSGERLRLEHVGGVGSRTDERAGLRVGRTDRGVTVGQHGCQGPVHPEERCGFEEGLEVRGVRQRHQVGGHRCRSDAVPGQPLTIRDHDVVGPESRRFEHAHLSRQPGVEGSLTRLRRQQQRQLIGAEVVADLVDQPGGLRERRGGERGDRDRAVEVRHRRQLARARRPRVRRDGDARALERLDEQDAGPRCRIKDLIGLHHRFGAQRDRSGDGEDAALLGDRDVEPAVGIRCAHQILDGVRRALRPPARGRGVADRRAGGDDDVHQVVVDHDR